MPQIWMRFRHLSALGAFKMDHLPKVRPIWFHTLLRNSRPSKIRKDMMHVAQNLKITKKLFFTDSDSQAQGIGAGLFPGTLEASGSQFLAIFSWFNVGKLVHCPTFPHVEYR